MNLNPKTKGNLQKYDGNREASYIQYVGEGLATSKGSHWQKMRKILTNTFHFRILKDFEPIINEKSMNLINRLQENNGKDIKNAVFQCTMEIICSE